MNPDLFEPFEKLIEITVDGVRCRVPENNTLLRCLQYVSIETISYGDFCWNGDCLNCRVKVNVDGREKDSIACLVKIQEGSVITTVSPEIELDIKENEPD